MSPRRAAPAATRANANASANVNADANANANADQATNVRNRPSPGVPLFEFATTLLSSGYWKQCPVSGMRFDLL